MNLEVATLFNMGLLDGVVIYYFIEKKFNVFILIFLF